MIDTKVTLELQKNGIQRTVYCKTGETAGARRLLITLTNNGSVIDVSKFTFSAQLQYGSDHKYMPVGCVTKDEDCNVIKLELPPAPKTEYYVELECKDSASRNVYSPSIRIIAENSIGSGASGSYEGASYNKIDENSYYTKTEIDDKLIDVAESIYDLDNKIKDAGCFKIEITAGDDINSGESEYTADEIYNAIKSGRSAMVFLSMNLGFFNSVSYYIVHAFSLSTSAVDIYTRDPSDSGSGYVNKFHIKNDKTWTRTRLSYKEFTQADKTKLDSLSNYDDSGLRTLINAKADKSELPVIPENISAFTNDVGYLTRHQDISGKQDKLVAGDNIQIIGNVISSTGGAESRVIELMADPDTMAIKYTPSEVGQLMEEGGCVFVYMGYPCLAMTLNDAELEFFVLTYYPDDIPTAIVLRFGADKQLAGEPYNVVIQPKLTAGNGITITGNTISAKTVEVIPKGSSLSPTDDNVYSARYVNEKLETIGNWFANTISEIERLDSLIGNVESAIDRISEIIGGR